MVRHSWLRKKITIDQKWLYLLISKSWRWSDGKILLEVIIVDEGFR